MKRDCPLREPSRLLPFILACACLAACGPAPTRGEAVRDVTFFVLSDIHVGAEDAKTASTT